MPEEPLRINVEKRSLAARGRRRRFPWILVAMMATLVIVGAWIALRPRGANVVAPIRARATQQRAPQTRVESVAVPGIIAEDDGEALWVSPTAGEPISLSYLPPGTQLLLHLRPADLLSHTEGEKVVSALGPFGQRAMDLVEQELGRTLSDVATLAVSVSPRADGGFDYALRAELLRRDDDAERLGNEQKSVSHLRTRFLPRQAAGSVLVSCPIDDAAELMAAGEDPARFSRDMQRLLARTDGLRIATLVLPSKFLETGGLKLIRGRGEPLRALFRDLVGDATTAVAFSLHWGDDFFFEMQSTVELGQRPHRFALALEQSMRQAPNLVEEIVLAEPPDPHGRKVVAQLPAMLRILSNYTRSGEEQGVSVTRCYLPAAAGHNLLMAAELLLNRPGE